MKDFRIWEGIYESFAAAGGTTEVFGETLWVERSTEKGRRLRETSRLPGFTPPTNTSHEYCVPVIAALAQSRTDRLRLLEFGGSVGFSFSAIVDALARPEDVEVHVVDNAAICAAGRQVFGGEPRIVFHTERPPAIAFDVVHCGSSLQYSPRWIERVRELTHGRPEFLVFDDLPAGDVPTFVSLQNYYGKQIPHWFFDVREFVETVTRETGYRLFYKTRFVGTFLGKRGPFPMDNFPETHRIDNAYNLAFVRG